MFKHILFPTDGAATSKHIIKECVSFAKDAGAVITALHVIPRYSHEYDWELNGETKEQFLRECVSAAEEFLEEVNAAARAAGVPCMPMHVTNDYAYDAIIRTAEEKHCDLIAMASHGRKGVKGMILGSETQKVLTYTKLPSWCFADPMATDPIKNRPLAELLTGDHAERAHTLNLRDIELFAAMSGDVNPVHVGHEFAHNDPFHRVVAHGMWVGAQISAVLGTMLPGPGTISRSQSRAGAIEADKAELIVPVLVRPRANCPEWPPAPWQS